MTDQEKADQQLGEAIFRQLVGDAYQGCEVIGERGLFGGDDDQIVVKHYVVTVSGHPLRCALPIHRGLIGGGEEPAPAATDTVPPESEAATRPSEPEPAAVEEPKKKGKKS